MIYGLCYIIVIAFGFVQLFDSMVLGYTLTPVVCWLLLFWLVSSRGRVIILLEALVLALMMIFISSRGCVITVAAAILVVLYYNNYRKGKSNNVKRIFVTYAPILLFAFIASEFVIPRIADSDMVLSGSMMSKMNNLTILDDNGRNEISSMAISLVKDNPIRGVGICKDRDILGYVFPHNIFIEICLHYGIPIGLLLFFLYWRQIIKLVGKNDIHYISIALVIVMCCYTWIRLLVSDTYLDNTFPLLFILGIAVSIYQSKQTVYR